VTITLKYNILARSWQLQNRRTLQVATSGIRHISKQCIHKLNLLGIYRVFVKRCIDFHFLN